MGAVVYYPRAFRRLVIVAFVLMFVALSGAQTSVKNCSSTATKCGLPIVFLGSGASGAVGSDVFTALRSANPSLYPSDVEYHVFYDSRTQKVRFQDGNGMNGKPDTNARLFVISWHDGSSTDWRSIDASLAARTSAATKADELAHIAWAIKSATLAPRVILVGGNDDLAAAKYYVAGKAAHDFNGAVHSYNNDVHGMFATDAKVSAETPALNAMGISALLVNSAADQYATRNLLTAGSTVRIADGITAPSTSVRRGQSVQFTSKIGPAVWSVLEGPSVGTINRNGVFTSATSTGTAHIVAVSAANHTIVAVSTVSVNIPVVTTKAVSSITSATATFNGTVNPNGQSGVAGFQYSTNASFAPATTSATVAASGSTTTNYSIPQTRLVHNTTYYVRGFFRNSAGVTTLGNAVSFATFGSFVVATNPAAVTSSDATLEASANGGGVAGSVYFAYSTDNFVHTLNTARTAIPGDTSTHKVSARITVLKTATPYKFKAIFDQGAIGPALQISNVVSFTTWGIFAENDKPNWAVSITAHGATFPGKYGTGGAAARVWIEISTSPTFAGGASVYGAFNVPAGTYTYPTVNITVSTLAKGTTYYIRYAIRNAENGFTFRYPFTRSFTTLGASVASLASSYNREGIVTDGTTFTNGYDGGCCALSSNLLGAGTTFAGVPYTYGVANGLNVVAASGQTVPLKVGNWTTLNLLGSGVNGNQSGPFVVHYADGSSTTFSQNMSDWFTPQGYPGETNAVVMGHRDQFDGSIDSRTFYLYKYSFALDSAKTVQSVTLPNNTNINVVAMTLNH